jgi:hypothetical protein
LRYSIGLFKKPKPKLTVNQARNNYSCLLGCYTLASTLHDLSFQDAIATKIVGLLRSSNGYQSQLISLITNYAVRDIISRYRPKSPLLMLIASAYARFASAEEIATLAFAKYPGELKSYVLKRWRY